MRRAANATSASGRHAYSVVSHEGRLRADVRSPRAHGGSAANGRLHFASQTLRHQLTQRAITYSDRAGLCHQCPAQALTRRASRRDITTPPPQASDVG